MVRIGAERPRFRRKLDPEALVSERILMADQDQANKLSWPWWAPWALLAVALTSVLTIGATLYDIL